MKRSTWGVTAVLLLAAVVTPPPARAGTLLVADAGYNTVNEYDASTGTAINSNFIYTPTSSGGYGPGALALDSNNNHLFVLNDISGINTASEYNATTGALITANFLPGLTGLAGSAKGLLNTVSLAVGSGHLFVAPNYVGGPYPIGEYDAVTGAFIQNIDFGGESYAMTVDSSGHLFVSAVIGGNPNATVREYDASTGALINPTFINDPALNAVTAFAVDSSGDLFASQFSTNVMREYDSSGGFIRSIGPAESWGVALDNSGHLFVSYDGADLVEKYNASTGAVINANFINSGNSTTGLVFVPSVPEPNSMVLASLGAAGMAVGVWRQRRKRCFGRLSRKSCIARSWLNIS